MKNNLNFENRIQIHSTDNLDDKSTQLIDINTENTEKNKNKLLQKHPVIGKLLLSGAISFSLFLNSTPAFSMTSKTSDFLKKDGKPTINQIQKNDFNQKDIDSLLESEISHLNEQNNSTTEIITYGGKSYVVKLDTQPQLLGTERSGYNANSNLLNVLGIDTGGIYGNQQSYDTYQRYKVICRLSCEGLNTTIIGQSSEYVIKLNSQSNTNIMGINFQSNEQNVAQYNIPSKNEEEAKNDAKSQYMQFLAGNYTQNYQYYQNYQQPTYEQPNQYTQENIQQNIELPPDTYTFPNLPETLSLTKQSYIFFKGLPEESQIIITISYDDQSQQKIINYHDEDGHLFSLNPNMIQKVTGKRDYASLIVDVIYKGQRIKLKGIILLF